MLSPPFQAKKHWWVGRLASKKMLSELVIFLDFLARLDYYYAFENPVREGKEA